MYVETESQEINCLAKEYRVNKTDLYNNEEETLSDELTMIITEYENQPNITKEVKKELEIFKMARQHTLKYISTKTGINTVRLRKIIESMTRKLKKFYANLKKDLY